MTVLSPMSSSILFGYYVLATSRMILKWDSKHPTVVKYTYRFFGILFNVNSLKLQIMEIRETVEIFHPCVSLLVL